MLNQASLLTASKQGSLLTTFKVTNPFNLTNLSLNVLNGLKTMNILKMLNQSSEGVWRIGSMVLNSTPHILHEH